MRADCITERRLESGENSLRNLLTGIGGIENNPAISINIRFAEIKKLTGVDFYNDCGYMAVSGPGFVGFQVKHETQSFIITSLSRTGSTMRGHLHQHHQ